MVHRCRFTYQTSWVWTSRVQGAGARKVCQEGGGKEITQENILMTKCNKLKIEAKHPKK